jgi:hypothetical protein
LSKERYHLFKLILMSLIKENLDVSIYEDSLRCIFGKDAGLLFFTDKIISNVSKFLFYGFRLSKICQMMISRMQCTVLIGRFLKTTRRARKSSWRTSNLP